MLQQMVLTTVTKACQEKIGLARSIVYTTHFLRAGPSFWERVPISPVLGLPFQKGRVRVKFWFGRDKIWYGKIISLKNLPSRTLFLGMRAIFIGAVPKIFCANPNHPKSIAWPSYPGTQELKEGITVWFR